MAYRAGNLVGLADNRARYLGAHCKHRALDVAGVLLEHVAHARRHAADQAFRVMRAGADRVRGIGGELAERALRVGGARLHRFAELLHPRVDHARGGVRQVADRSLRLAGVDLQATALRVHIISEEWMATQPFPFPARRPHLVPRPLGDELPFELSKTQENIQRQPPQ